MKIDFGMTRIKLSRLIACGFLLLAIANIMPYGYYSFFRIPVTIISVINAFHVFKKNKILFIIFLVIAMLFNPLLPVHLNKEMWVIIDLITGLFFGVMVFIKINGKDEDRSPTKAAGKD